MIGNYSFVCEFINVNETTVRLDKTWRDIKDALSIGIRCVVHTVELLEDFPSEYADNYMNISRATKIASGDDVFYEVDVTHSNGTTLTFTSASPDGFPVFEGGE